MVGKSKTYVINPVESFMQKGGIAKRGIERTLYSPDAEKAQAPRARSRREKRREIIEEKGSPLLTFLAYLAGPYAILTTRRGRESRFWVTLAILSCLGAVVVLARWKSIFAGPHESAAGYLLWMSVACLASLVGFMTWARAVYLIGRCKRGALERLPVWIGHPGIAGVFGLVIPGYGLFVARHPRRAAGALLAAGAAAISALILWQAPELWRLSHSAGPIAGHCDCLERIFLAMAAVASFGALTWIVQALDGMRLAGLRMQGAAQPQGNWAAVALIVALVALLATFRPSHVAETIDRFAISLREDGLRVIPLQAVCAAMRLDPSRSEYAVQAIEMNGELGRAAEAADLKRDLEERWKPYERMLRLEASSAEAAAIGPEKT